MDGTVFDFLVIVFSLLPATGEYAMIARLARLLRVLRLISTIQELRLIVSTLVRSIPSMGHVMLLMSIIFYIYAITGYQLFHEHDPVHWRNLGISLLSLFRIVTLEDWTDIMYTAMELHPMAWMYFVSFVVLARSWSSISLSRWCSTIWKKPRPSAFENWNSPYRGRNLTRPSLDSEGLAPFGRTMDRQRES